MLNHPFGKLSQNKICCLTTMCWLTRTLLYGELALSDAEIVALEHNNTENDEDESEELTPVTLSEAKVSVNKLRNFFLQDHVDADIL
ncbi:hypothetical protein TNCV_3983681 [Trichonephila clavipes]|nr:hypothetical protein TNCV_3983681 [Trichonephila clavipes]